MFCFKRFVVAIMFMTLSGYSFLSNAKIENVDLHDVSTYSKSAQERELAQNLSYFVNKNQKKIGVPGNLFYATEGLTQIKQQAIYSAHLQNLKMSDAVLKALLFVVYFDGVDLKLNKAKIKMNSMSDIVVSELQSFDLKKEQVHAEIDLIQRQMKVIESKSGFIKYYPMGVGALAPKQISDSKSGYRTLSPTFSRALFSRQNSEVYRNDPSYYAGRPFLRIIDKDQYEYGGFTPFGAHYHLADRLQRGFISNGCFRMRDNDLYELSTIVFSTELEGVELSVEIGGMAENSHPYPQINSWFNTPNVVRDSSGNLKYEKDQHNLFIFNRIVANPFQFLN